MTSHHVCVVSPPLVVLVHLERKIILSHIKKGVFFSLSSFFYSLFSNMYYRYFFYYTILFLSSLSTLLLISFQTVFFLSLIYYLLY